MTTEQQKAFEAWWSDPAPWSFEGNNREIFCAGWNAAMENRFSSPDDLIQWLEGRRHERREVRKTLMRLAGIAYCEGTPDEADLYRRLANLTFPEF